MEFSFLERYFVPEFFLVVCNQFVNDPTFLFLVFVYSLLYSEQIMDTLTLREDNGIFSVGCHTALEFP